MVFEYFRLLFFGELEAFFNIRLDGDLFANRRVWCEDAAPAYEVAFRRRHQSHKLFNELGEGKEEVCRAVTVWSFELKLNFSIGCDFEPFIGQGGPLQYIRLVLPNGLWQVR